MTLARSTLPRSLSKTAARTALLTAALTGGACVGTLSDDPLGGNDTEGGATDTETAPFPDTDTTDGPGASDDADEPTSDGPEPACGNGVVDVALGEACDPTVDPNPPCPTWENVTKVFGMAECTAGCTIDASDCTYIECGDGFADSGEDCDGGDLGGETCESLGWKDGGQLACTSWCSFDTRGCGAVCGNGVVDGREACDGEDFGGASCESLGLSEGVLACDRDCLLVTTGCTTACGNGALDPGEDCDGAELGGQACGDVGFVGGTLACDGSCSFDTTGCNTCGDGTLDPGEDCDGAELGGQSCTGLGLGAGLEGGTLACDGSCSFDTSGCTALPGVGDVVVSELMTGTSWFELDNPGAQAWSLQGCQVEGFFGFETFPIDSPLTVPAGGQVVLASTGDAGVLGFSPDFVMPAAFALAASGDVIRLRCNGTTVDQVVYDDVPPWPVPPAGTSLALSGDAIDATANDDGSVWCEGSSPGAANPVCP